MLISAPVYANDNKPRIAVYVTGSVPDNEKKVLGTRMLTALIRSGRYSGIERSESFLAEIQREHIKQRSGAIDDDQISKLGKQFGVRYVCIADITPAYNAYQVSARIINVETAEVAFIGEAFSPLKTTKDLTEASDKVVANMFGIPLKRKPWMSAGFGFLYANEFGGGIMWGDVGNGKAQISMPYSGAGAYVFFDAMYGLANIGYAMGSKKWESDNVSSSDDLPVMRRTSVTLGLYGKYPIALGSSQKIALFPLAGFNYEMSLTGKLEYAGESPYAFDGEETRPAANALSAVWVKFGGGADINLNDNVYIRAEALYGLRGANTFESDMAKLEKNEGVNAEPKSGAGVSVRLSAGYRF